MSPVVPEHLDTAAFRDGTVVRPPWIRRADRLSILGGSTVMALGRTSLLGGRTVQDHPPGRKIGVEISLSRWQSGYKSIFVRWFTKFSESMLKWKGNACDI